MARDILRLGLAHCISDSAPVERWPHDEVCKMFLPNKEFTSKHRLGQMDQNTLSC